MADAAARRQDETCIGGGGGGISALPDHVLHEIFSRVGNFKDLFMFAVTCRLWIRRFTDRAFLRELCPNLQGGDGQQGHRARLLGCFLERTVAETRMMRPQAQRSSVLAPTFLPGPGSPFGPAARALTSFVSDDDGDGIFNYAKPLSARRGILLLKLARPRTSNEQTTCHRFALCNPVTGERHVLPPLEWIVGCGSMTVTTYAIVTAADTDSSLGDLDGNSKKQPAASLSGSGAPQLVLTTQDDQTETLRHLHLYSAATRSWSTPAAFLKGRRFSVAGERSAVVHRGAAHWLCIARVPKNERASGDGGDRLHKLSVELATSRVTFTELPVRVGGRPLLSTSRDGKLVVVSVYPVHVAVWTQQDGDGDGDGDGEGDDGGDDTHAHAAWPRTAAFRIPGAVPDRNVHTLWDSIHNWFNFNNGTVLVMYRNSGVFILDLEKKAMEKVMDCVLSRFVVREAYPPRCVAYEMDFVEFFTLQLGGVRDKLGTMIETES